MEIKQYKTIYFEQIIELFKTTIQSVNSKDYTKSQIDAWIDIDIDSWEKRLIQNFTLVAIENEILTGFAEFNDNAYIHTLFVHKDHQRKKIAYKLLDSLLKEARSREYKVIYSDVSITAKPFFEKMGFEVIKKQYPLRNGVLLQNFKMKKVI